MPENRRTFTREQLATLGLPDNGNRPNSPTPNPQRATFLHEEQTDTRRWVSVHQLVFRAPDDGKTWAIEYRQGLTESQDDTDPWNEENTVTAVEVEQRPVVVQQWHPVNVPA